jgi:hypothetical protein
MLTINLSITKTSRREYRKASKWKGGDFKGFKYLSKTFKVSLWEFSEALLKD